ncbi:hypothetical protein SETIT_9G328600v2 [Setaria italica]|uniref:Uncharacterized protein n=2 Tax=Setaria TaxID=4554 RepID=A0A368SQ35_SETIT|nr:hypothetical protein SETIT_9G328600v2 [Setaria italica]TKV95020.1 hypothetical protein SEVIR_9G334566v2 [Setaria viridis]
MCQIVVCQKADRFGYSKSVNRQLDSSLTKSYQFSRVFSVLLPAISFFDAIPLLIPNPWCVCFSKHMAFFIRENVVSSFFQGKVGVLFTGVAHCFSEFLNITFLYIF